MRHLLPLLFLLVVPAAYAQHMEHERGGEAAVLAVVERMFDGMRAGDSTTVRAVMHPEAVFRTVAVRDGQARLFTGDVERFLAAVGTPHDDVWDERTWDEEVRIDGDLATAWTPYAFYLGEARSHCGVNAFQLFRTPEAGWQIIAITDTRHQDCAEPGVD